MSNVGLAPTAARRAPIKSTRTAADGSIEHRCCKCDRFYPASAFYASSLRRGVTYCRDCRTRQEYEKRHTSPDLEAEYALYTMEHTRFGRQGHIPLPFVTAVLDAAHRKSAISGATERLRIRRFWAELPLSLENAVVVTADENRILGRKKRWLELFPADLVARMTAWRDAQLAAAAAAPSLVSGTL